MNDEYEDDDELISVIDRRRGEWSRWKPHPRDEEQLGVVWVIWQEVQTDAAARTDGPSRPSTMVVWVNIDMGDVLFAFLTR